MNNQRAMHSMIRSGSKLYVFGGTGAEESTGEVYSTKDGIWGVFSWSVPMNDGVSMEPGSPVVIRYDTIKTIFALPPQIIHYYKERYCYVRFHSLL